MTGLVQNKVPLVFKSLNTKMDSRHLVIGDLIALRNVALDNWPKLNKRNGHKQLTAAAAGSSLNPFKREVLLGTGAEAFSYAAATTSNLVDKGVLEAMTVSARPVRRDAYNQTTPDSAVHPLGITVYTWETTAAGIGAQYAVFDTVTGQPIVTGVGLGSTAVKPKALALGANVVILFYDTATNHIRYIVVPALNPTTPSIATDFAIDPATTQIFDATVIGGLYGSLFLVYANNGGANKITLRYLTAQAVLSATLVPTTAEAFTTCCSVFGDSSNRVWVAYYNGSAVKMFGYDFQLANQLLTFTSLDAAPGTVRNITGIATPNTPTGTTATVFYEATGSAPYNNLINVAWKNLDQAGGGSSTLIRSVGLASKPFFYLNRIHVLAAYQSTLQSTYSLLSCQSVGGQTIVGKLAPSVGGGLTAKSILPEMNTISPGVFATTYLQTDQISSTGVPSTPGLPAAIATATVFSQAGVMAGTFDFTQPQTAVELSDDLHLTSGILAMYDGTAVTEHGFHLYPENITATPSATGGLILAGQYQYVGVYEWMDAQGLIHQSAPSPPVQVTTTGTTSSVTVVFPTLRLTNKPTSVVLVIYRTQGNQLVFYRLNSISAPLLNSTTVDTISFLDQAADTAIVGNAQLYSNPLNALAEIPNISAPAPLYVWRYRNRVALIPAENAFQWAYSKAFVAGVPIEFNPQQLYQSVSQDGGPLTCGIEMDEKNILFTASTIYYVSGDGPAPNGTLNDYGASPQNIPSDVGCVNRRSLVLTPQGVMFQSAKGIYLLGRDLTVNYIGAAVEAFNNLTITAAKKMPNSRRVIFFTNGSIALVWDYFAEKWAVFTNQNAADATVFGGLITYVKPTGQLWQETPGLFTDNGAPILIGLTTSWLSFAGLLGFQRVWRFGIEGEYRSLHSLTVSVAYDGSPAALQTQTVVNAATLVGAGPPGDTILGDTENPGDGVYPPYEFIVKLLRQKCSSIQVTLQENQIGPTPGEGLTLSGITFLVGSLKGLHPAPKSRVI
jgi:hypothetical protein